MPRKKKPGRKPLKDSNKRFRIVTYCSFHDIEQDKGVSRYLIAMNKELNKQIIKTCKKTYNGK